VVLTARRFAVAAAILTPVLGIAFLVRVTYVAEQCFRTATFGGCTYPRTDLTGVLAVAPLQVVAPVCVVLILTALAVGAGAASVADRDGYRVAAFTAGYVVLVAPLTLLIGPIFVVPLLLLVASTLLMSGATPREVAMTMVIGTVLVFGAFAAALDAIALWGARFGPVPLGSQPIWLYVGLATALGIAAGCIAVGRRRAARELTRALVLAYLGFGVGAVAALLAILPATYPRGRLVGLGMSGVWLTAWTLLVADLVAGVVIWRFGGRLTLRGALGATAVCAMVFVLAAATMVAVAPRVVAGDMLPPVPLLPSTSTSR
jgi:hypothetical protein